MTICANSAGTSSQTLPDPGGVLLEDAVDDRAMVSPVTGGLPVSGVHARAEGRCPRWHQRWWPGTAGRHVQVGFQTDAGIRSPLVPP